MLKALKTKPPQDRWFLLGCLVSLELLMSFSFFGYLHVEPVSITFAYIPVLIGGCLLGPVDSTILGIVFGLASLWKASASYVMDFDRVFSPFLSGSPVRSLLLSVGSRALFGLLIGLLYQLANRSDRHTTQWLALVTLFGKHLHSILVYGAVGLLFPQLGYGVKNAFYNGFSIENLLAGLLSICTVLGCRRLQQSARVQRFWQNISFIKNLHLTENYHWLSLAVVLAAVLASSGAVTLYFVQRLRYMLRVHGQDLSHSAYSDLLHLQVQFLLGILSLCCLLIIFLIYNRRHATFMNYQAKMDALTGAFTRKAFFQIADQMIPHMVFQGAAAGHFLILDVDRFKQINDQFGHPAGDRILQQIARCLQEHFSDLGVIGRLGGDEFVVLLHAPLPQGELEPLLNKFMASIHAIPCGDLQVSCSIGIAPILAPISAEAYYQKADESLYQAKSLGRDQYVLGVLNDLSQAKGGLS